MCRGPAKDSRAWNVQPTAAIEHSLTWRRLQRGLSSRRTGSARLPSSRSISVAEVRLRCAIPRASPASGTFISAFTQQAPIEQTCSFYRQTPCALFAHSQGNASCNEWITTTAVFPVSAAGCARAYPRNDRINCSDVVFSGGHDPSSLFPDSSASTDRSCTACI